MLAKTAIIGILTLGSRLLGMVREIIYARVFGATAAFDAFLIAFSIPNMARRLFGEGALSNAFIPTFVERLNKEGHQSARNFLNAVWSILLVCLLLITALGVLLTFIIPLIYFHPKLQLTLEILRITLPYLILICLTAVLSSALNGMHHYVTPALAPILLNIVLIVVVFTAQGTIEQKVMILAIAIIIGGALQLVVQLPPLAAKKSVPGFSTFKDKDLGRVMKLFLPIAFVSTISQINEFLDLVIAEIFIPGNGAVSVLNYANRLIQLPYSVIGISLATVAFTNLSEKASQTDKEPFKHVMVSAINTCFFLCIPALAGLAVFSGPIVDVIFKRGEFTDEAAFRTSQCIIFYTPSILFYAIATVFTKAFYALKDVNTPTKINLILVGLNFITNIIFVLIMKESGIALTTSLCGFLSAVALGKALKKKIGWNISLLWKPLARSVLLSIAMLALCFAIFNIPATLVIKVIFMAMGGFLFYLGAAYLLKFPELKDAIRNF